MHLPEVKKNQHYQFSMIKDVMKLMLKVNLGIETHIIVNMPKYK